MVSITLKPQLEAMISGYDGKWSVYVKDLESNEDFALNDKPLYSASLIKAFVMAKTYQDMDDVLKNEAAQMKTTVDNTKSTGQSEYTSVEHDHGQR